MVGTSIFSLRIYSNSGDPEKLTKQLFLMNDFSVICSHFCSAVWQQQVQSPQVFLIHFLDQLCWVKASAAGGAQGLQKSHEIFALKTPGQPWRNTCLWGVYSNVHEEVMFGKKVAVGQTSLVKVSRQLGKHLIEVKNEPSQLLPFWLRQKKWLVAKNNIIEESRQDHKSVEPLYNDIPSQPWLQNLLDCWQQTFDFHGLGSQFRKRNILQHVQCQVAKATGGVLGPVMAFNGIPQQRYILFCSAWHHLLCHEK